MKLKNLKGSSRSNVKNPLRKGTPRKRHSERVAEVPDFELLKAFCKRIDIIVLAGSKLLDFMTSRKKLAQKNFIVYGFVRKTTRILAAIRKLAVTGLHEEGQILARALIETRINLEYFLILIKQFGYKVATGRIVAAMMIDKLKALRAVNFDFGGDGGRVDKAAWECIEKEIREAYGDDLFKKIRQHGFSGVSVEERAVATGNKELYHLGYRIYSRNVHANDMHEQFGGAFIPEAFAQQKETMLGALDEAACNCGRLVIEEVNDWLGQPLGDLKNPKKSRSSLEV